MHCRVGMAKVLYSYGLLAMADVILITVTATATPTPSSHSPSRQLRNEGKGL